MTKQVPVLLLLISIVLGCTPSTKLTTSMKAPDVAPKQFNKLAILAFLPDISNRATVEAAVEEQLRAQGIKGSVTFDLFPLAGDKELIQKMGLDPDSMKEIVRKKVTENAIDGLLTISLLDANREERYVEGSNFSVGVPLNAVDPAYGYTYYDYYHYAYTTVSKPGYYIQSSTYFFESNLYDIASEALIWTAQTTTKDPDSVEKEAMVFGKIITKDLLRKKVVAK
jgi:hypothetical protein